MLILKQSIKSVYFEKISAVRIFLRVHLMKFYSSTCPILKILENSRFLTISQCQAPSGRSKRGISPKCYLRTFITIMNNNSIDSVKTSVSSSTKLHHLSFQEEYEMFSNLQNRCISSLAWYFLIVLGVFGDTHLITQKFQ